MAQDQPSDSENLDPETYLQTLQEKNLEPLWIKFKQPTPLKPNPRAVSCIWKYSEYLPLLRKATEEAEEADRRALLLINPNMTSYHTTDTLHGGLLIVQPGETIPARRHLPYIIRFVIDGEGFTSVDGKKMSMRRGDVIVIPGYQWYDHGNESDAPVIWLDILNLELSSVVPGSYSELFRGSHYSSTRYENSRFLFPWEPVVTFLNSQEVPHAIYHYSHGGDGKPISIDMTLQAERLDGHHRTTCTKETGSFMYHCFEGQGYTEIQTPRGKTDILYWIAGDIFAIPAGSEIRHVNTSDDCAFLVGFTDRPLLEMLERLKPLR